MIVIVNNVNQNGGFGLGSGQEGGGIGRGGGGGGGYCAQGARGCNTFNRRRCRCFPLDALGHRLRGRVRPSQTFTAETLGGLIQNVSLKAQLVAILMPRAKTLAGIATVAVFSHVMLTGQRLARARLTVDLTVQTLTIVAAVLHPLGAVQEGPVQSSRVAVVGPFGGIQVAGVAVTVLEADFRRFCFVARGQTFVGGALGLAVVAQTRAAVLAPREAVRLLRAVG